MDVVEEAEAHVEVSSAEELVSQEEEAEDLHVVHAKEAGQEEDPATGIDQDITILDCYIFL